MKFDSILLAAFALAVCCGCEEDKPEESKEPAVEAATPEPAAEEKASPSEADEEAAGEEDATNAEEEKAQAEIEANPLTECCRALGKQAFTLRSPEYHGASKVCGEALTAKKGISAVLPEIKKSLKDKALPGECSE